MRRLRKLRLSRDGAHGRFLDSTTLPVKTSNAAPLEMTELGNQSFPKVRSLP
jgi:hypothetical protein